MKHFVRVLLFAFVCTILFQANAAQAAQVHRVKSGDTINLIAQQYGVTVNEIIDNNKYILKSDQIFTGQVLIIPAQVTPVKEEPGVYQVEPGDTLFKIAGQFNVAMADLAEQNNLSNWDYLYVGQSLTIPGQDQATGQTAPPARVTSTPRPELEETVYSLAREFGDTVFLKGQPGSYKVALTFDDGPDSIYTGQVLDALKQHGIPATFFLIGRNANEYPQVVQRIFEDGHVIGNHSWSHPRLTRVGPEQLQQEIRDTEKELQNITGHQTTLMRPPYGEINRETLIQLKDMGYKAINWSVDSVDWRDADVDQILINTLPDVGDGSIILMHSAGGKGQDFSATVAALPELIYTLQVHGYEFVTVDELLAVPAYK